MGLAIILDPVGQRCKDGSGVCEGVSPGVFAFQRFDETLGHTVAFRTEHRREHYFEAEPSRQVGGVLCGVSAAVVR